MFSICTVLCNHYPLSSFKIVHYSRRTLYNVTLLTTAPLVSDSHWTTFCLRLFHIRRIMHLTSPCLASFTVSIQTVVYIKILFLLEAEYLSVCVFAVLFTLLWTFRLFPSVGHCVEGWEKHCLHKQFSNISTCVNWFSLGQGGLKLFMYPREALNSLLPASTFKVSS